MPENTARQKEMAVSSTSKPKRVTVKAWAKASPSGALRTGPFYRRLPIYSDRTWAESFSAEGQIVRCTITYTLHARKKAK